MSVEEGIAISVAEDPEERERRKSLLFDTMHDGLILQAPDGRIIEWNAAAPRVLGLSEAELRGTTPLDPQWQALHPDGSPWSWEEHPAMVAQRTGSPVRDAIMGIDRPDRGRGWIRVSATPLVAPTGEVTGAVTTFTDITDQRAAEAALARSEDLHRTTLEALDQGVVLIRDARVQLANPAAQQITGYSSTHLEQLWFSGRWHSWDEDGRPLAAEERILHRALLTGEPIRGEVVQWRRCDGTRILLRVSALPVPGSSDTVVIAFTDITAERRAERLLDATLAAAPVGLAVLDADLRVVRANETYARQRDLDPEGLAGVDAATAVHPDDRGPLEQTFRAAARSERPGITPDLRLGAAEPVRWISTTVRRLDEGDRQLLVTATVDITPRVLLERDLKALSDELAHEASHDHLTGLPNRALIEDLLAEALDRAEGHGHRIGLGYIDLDGFKAVNDRHGHGAGDQVLQAVAHALRSSVRASDTAGRMGGDEFVVLLDPVAHEHQAVTTVTRALRSITDGPGDEPPVAEVGASAGLSLSRPGDGPWDLIDRADDALYLGKRSGRGQVRVG